MTEDRPYTRVRLFIHEIEPGVHCVHKLLGGRRDVLSGADEDRVVAVACELGAGDDSGGHRGLEELLMPVVEMRARRDGRCASDRGRDDILDRLKDIPVAPGGHCVAVSAVGGLLTGIPAPVADFFDQRCRYAVALDRKRVPGIVGIDLVDSRQDIRHFARTAWRGQVRLDLAAIASPDGAQEVGHRSCPGCHGKVLAEKRVLGTHIDAGPAHAIQQAVGLGRHPQMPQRTHKTTTRAFVRALHHRAQKRVNGAVAAKKGRHGCGLGQITVFSHVDEGRLLGEGAKAVIEPHPAAWSR